MPPERSGETMQSCSVPPIYLGRYLLLVLARNTYLGSERYYEESGSGCTKWLHNACVRVRAPGPPPPPPDSHAWSPHTSASATPRPLGVRCLHAHPTVQHPVPTGKHTLPWSPVCSSAAPLPAHTTSDAKKKGSKKKASSKDEGGVEAGGALWLPTGWLLAPRPRRSKQGDERGPQYLFCYTCTCTCTSTSTAAVLYLEWYLSLRLLCADDAAPGALQSRSPALPATLFGGLTACAPPATASCCSSSVRRLNKTNSLSSTSPRSPSPSSSYLSFIPPPLLLFVLVFSSPRPFVFLSAFLFLSSLTPSQQVDTLSQEILALGLTRSFKDGPSLLLLLDSPSNPLGNHSSFTHLAV